jgi:hypothetical protein
VILWLLFNHRVAEDTKEHRGIIQFRSFGNVPKVLKGLSCRQVILANYCPFLPATHWRWSPVIHVIIFELSTETFD